MSGAYFVTCPSCGRPVLLDADGNPLPHVCKERAK
jgi:hypothetical protein